jgi:hypothetical protein
VITWSWDKTEVRKWEASEVSAFDGTRLYTPAERKFLKEKYVGEFKFLHQHELNINHDEGREEARAILGCGMHEEEQAED